MSPDATARDERESLPPCCLATTRLVREQGQARRCLCGETYFVSAEPLVTRVDLIEAPDPLVHRATLPAPPPSRELARAVEEVATALRVEREDRADNQLPRLSPVNPLARLIANAGTADRDASDREVRGLAAQVLSKNPGRVGSKRRVEFLDAFYRYCDETSRPSDLPGAEEYDRDAARRHLARLARLPDAARQVLSVVARGGPSQGWPEAVARVAAELLPRPAAGVYGAARAEPGVRVPEEVRRRAEADGMLRAAIDAWEGGV